MCEIDDKIGMEAYDKLKAQLIAANFDDESMKKVDMAFELANKAHKNAEQFRKSGEPYIIHPVAVASILCGMGMDTDTICAALLHDVVEDTAYTTADIEKLLGKTIAYLVDGVTKLTKVPLDIQSEEEQKAESLRKMMIAMSNDIRVIIIKLADRLHNMRTLNFMLPEKQKQKAHETLEIYAPIAHRLGIRPIKEELEDLAVRYIDPISYREIQQKLEEQNANRSEFLSSIIESIRVRLGELKIDGTVSGRIKSVHGIFKKMYMQNKSFEQIYDIYAVRIIVDNLIECYNCLGMVHEMFKPMPGRFKDYISMPKPNGYQSLHTTVLSSEGIPFEVQIRTTEMHKTAEYGIAAHWKYKLDLSDTSQDERLTWVRQVLENQSDSVDAEELISNIKSDLIPEEVYVFTPKGDVITLPKGSTVIDFAYAIHSQVGHRMTGARVDNKIVAIDYVVKTGQIVDIITTSQPGKGPSRDWLNIVKTSGARSKIRSWFKKERREENIVEGKTQVEREFRKAFIHLPDDEMDEFIKKIAEKQRCSSVEEFYAAIGYGGISLTKIMPRIRDEYNSIEKEKRDNSEPVMPKKIVKSSDGVVVEGIDNCLVKFARCCNPLPGDSIIGFITRGHGVSIHARNCPNVPDDPDKSAEPYRWLKAYWDQGVKEVYNSGLLIKGINRIGIIADVTAVLSSMRVSIANFNSRILKDDTFIINCTVCIDGIDHLNSVISKIEKINGVLTVERGLT